ncbi:MAG: hypothetical protein K8S55_05940 [Phycisphaerae bacterium]|nr:hypothetical protein [Phycisphaerae bacterium]
MARRKHNKALFEVLSKPDGASSPLSVPDWMKSTPTEQAGQPEVPAAMDEAKKDEKVESVEMPKDDQLVIEDPAETTAIAPADEELLTEADVITEESAAEEVAEKVEPAAAVVEEPAVEAKVEDMAEEGFEEPEQPQEEAGPPPIQAVTETPPPIQPAQAVRTMRQVLVETQSLGPWMQMSQLQAMVMLGVVLILLVAAFVGGRLTAPAPTGDPGGQGQPGRIGEPVGKIGEPVKAVAGQRDPKRQYLLIQVLKGDSDADKVEADRIIMFCEKRGIPADMVTIGKARPRVAVWCLWGFSSANSDVARAHAKRIEDIGKKYFNKFGTYKFLQRRKGKFAPFYYPGSNEEKR